MNNVDVTHNYDTVLYLDSRAVFLNTGLWIANTLTFKKMGDYTRFRRFLQYFYYDVKYIMVVHSHIATLLNADPCL